MSLRPKLSLIRGDTATPSQGLMEGREEVRSYMQRYRDKNRDKYNAYHREWRKKNKPMLSARNIERRKCGILAMTKQELKEFRIAEVEKTRRLNGAIKEIVFSHYGWHCACCGEKEHAFLSMDHVNNDGYKDRVGKSRSSAKLYRKIKNQGFPNIYQVLCMNCNFGKRMNNGICPHKQGVTTMAQASRPKWAEAPNALKRSMR